MKYLFAFLLAACTPAFASEEPPEPLYEPDLIEIAETCKDYSKYTLKDKVKIGDKFICLYVLKDEKIEQALAQPTEVKDLFLHYLMTDQTGKENMLSCLLSISGSHQPVATRLA